MNPPPEKRKRGRPKVYKDDRQVLVCDKTAKKGGRPVGTPSLQHFRALDEKKLVLMAQSTLSVESIAILMDCSADLLYQRYGDAIRKGRELRKYDLVTAMWEKALHEKDGRMMIWLSKQHLGYRDILPEEATQVHFNVFTNEIPK